MSTEFYLADGRRFARRNWCGPEHGPRLTLEVTRAEFWQLDDDAPIYWHEPPCPENPGSATSTPLKEFIREMLHYGCAILWETAHHLDEKRGDN